MKNTIKTTMNIEWTLTVLFILLKLTGVITWSWWWLLLVFCLFPLVIVAFVLIAILTVISMVIVEGLWRFYYNLFNK